MKSPKILYVLLLSLSLLVSAQNPTHQGFAHEQSEASGYVWPEDSLVRRNLDRWQDMKFGVLFHYGLYSLPGIVESWSICSEDVDWITRHNDLPYDEYKKWYWGLADSIAPTNLDASRWAEIMRDAGMKYMIFTTKHHDGFCTFDSRLTDFTIAKGPFRNDSRKNMAKVVFDAFREKGMSVGCYFSKPDWHSQWFWNDEFATPNRRINYKKERHPEWWRNYQEFTAGQLKELLGGDYGRFDILWLDGGWISGDDIGLDNILADVRDSSQPGIIAVDRTIRGKNENYQTPERGIPETALPFPWESCIPLSNDWGWVPDAPYKSSAKVISLLSEITAKGGSLLLGIGPTAKGEIEPEICRILNEVGKWLKNNGEAIYSTRPVRVYHDNGVWFTGSKDGKTIYAIFAPDDNTPSPSSISWHGNIPLDKVKHLSTGKTLRHTTDNNGRTTVYLPKGTFEPLALKFNTLTPGIE